MATTTSRVQAVVIALRDALRLRGGLAEVNVVAVPINPEDLLPEFIIVATEIPGEQTYPFTSNNTKDERFTLNGLIYAQVPGAGDDTAMEAMERATEILGEVEACLREDPTIGGVAVKAELGEFTHTASVANDNRAHDIQISVRVWTRLVSS